jgi:hypothetical protein
VPVRKRASLVVTASSVTVQQSARGAPPIINASISGFVNGDTASAQKLVPPTCVTSELVPQYPGTFQSWCEGGLFASYTAKSFSPGVVVVTPNGATTTASGALLPVILLSCVLLVFV